ncbi:MAG: amylo-alpha-1,6-glucosidase [Nitrospiraceae bacterium]
MIKDADLFFLTNPDGTVPLEEGHGLGLYYHDCRYLNGYEIRLGGMRLAPLAATASRGFMAKFELANLKMKVGNGRVLQREEIEVRWHRILDSQTPALDDMLTVQNLSRQPAEFPVSLTFRADFEDVYAVRGVLSESLGIVQTPVWINGILQFRYDGKDGLYRRLSVHSTPRPDVIDGATVHYRFHLDPRERTQVRLSFVIHETADQESPVPTYRQPDVLDLESKLQDSSDKWLASVTDIFSDSQLLEEMIDRSLRDLRVLRMRLHDEFFFAAGVPWFATLFGRDSLITAWQTLAYDPGISAQTLKLLASYQGRRVDEWRDEQPGKILHELRVGEAAHIGLIPHTPYYGSIDATPLFLMLIGRHAAWTGSLTLFHELHEHIERALEWMSRYGGISTGEYLAYAGTAERGLENQGWKDSGDAIVNEDGTLAASPIAVIEVQGYAYQALISMSELYGRAGDHLRAQQLRRDAVELRRRFNKDFWVPAKQCYALALEKDRKPVTVISSNPGHALWAGIADEDKAALTADRLMSADMFSGWGIRTLSEKETVYNPLGYHLGSVWPHDTSLIAGGFRQYGFDQYAVRLFEGLVKAASHFKSYQMPELFSGFSEKEYDAPVPYPAANHPQAWAAGALPYMVQSILGLTPAAFEHQLIVRRPVLPDFVDELEVQRLRVGDAEVGLRFERRSDHSVAVQVLKKHGRLDVVVTR